jgi:hypothetical protein
VPPPPAPPTTPVVPPRPPGFVPPTAAAPKPPPGYQPYAPSLPITSSAGLRTTVVVLFWIATAASLLMALAAFARRSTFDGFLEGSKTIDDLDSADAAVGGAFVLFALTLLVAAILLAIWSHRSVGNAKKVTGSLELRPGLAAWGWFIPIAYLFVPFAVLRRAAHVTGLDGNAVSRWQLGFLALFAGQVAFRVFGTFDAFRDDAGTVSDKLRNQGIVGVVVTIVLVLTTLAASKAMKQLDVGVERRNAGQPAM